jgi:N-acyl-D-amino-acid deacylase
MDFVIRGALVVDGTGAPGRSVDVRVSAGRIAEIAPTIDAAGAEIIDASGLVLAPGFIDVHTHYDAQVLWDRDLTPSSWHGVTTAVMGNCGFGIAPARPEHRGVIARTLENVEGMSVDALEAGIPWTFETFPEYLDAVGAEPLRLDVAAFVGHTPIRLYVMGDEATERAATEAEIAEMAQLVGEAIDAGAIGFSTSKANGHAGDGGKPVPSRLATIEEITTLAKQLGDRGIGVIEVTTGPGLFIDEVAQLSKDTGRPVTWAALFTGLGSAGRAQELVDRTEAAGGEVFPQIACRPIVMQVQLLDPFPFARVPGFEDVLVVPRDQRAAVYADPAWRDRVRNGITKEWGKSWPKTVVAESAVHGDLVEGDTLQAMADQAGVDPFDLMCDLSLAEDLRTRFRIVLVNDDEDEIGELLNDSRTLLGLSDAGAHASQLCDAGYSTHLLGHWVRDLGVITMEQAVWRLTGQPADVFGLTDRGRIVEGLKADLVLFDPATISAGDLERVYDLPAGADRLISRGVGMHDVWVAGIATRRNGEDLDGVRPGALVRAGR